VCSSVTNTLKFLPVFRQVNIAHVHTSYAFNIHRNIILPSTPMFSKCSLSARFPTRKSHTPFFSPLYTCRISCSSHCTSFYRPNNITCSVILYTGFSSLLLASSSHNLEVRHPRCVGSITNNCVLHIQSNTTILHPAVQ